MLKNATPRNEPFKPITKAEINAILAKNTGLSEKQVAIVLDTLVNLIRDELDEKGPGEFIIPGLLKLKVKRKPATKAKEGTNPFTGEPTTFRAKPARDVVKMTPLKALKDLA